MTEKKSKEFRRAVRLLDQKRLDKIFGFARKHGDARTMVNAPNKVDVVLIATIFVLIGWIMDLETVTDMKWE